MGTAVAPNPKPPSPAQAPKINPKLHYAVVVGIDCYPGLRNLGAARKDAEAFEAWLKKSGVPEENIFRVMAKEDVFPDPDTAIPTKQLVDIAFRKAHSAVRARVSASRSEWMQTRLYVYLSGHGVTPNASDAMVLMANAQQGVFGDSIACKLYMEYYSDVAHFRELVFFADCCRSFVLGTRPVEPPFDRIPQPRDVSKMLAFGAGFGSLAYEPTPEELSDPDNARGFFTQALLEGLSGKAVDVMSREINSSSLGRFIRSRVYSLTKHKPTGAQIPQFTSDPASPIVFVENVDPPKWNVRINVPPGTSAQVCVRDSLKVILEQGAPVNGVFTTALADGLYEAVILSEPPITGTVVRVYGEDVDVQI